MTIGPRFAAVLAAARDDQPWAYERLWREAAPRVSAYFRVQGAPEPDDLTSEVFLTAFRSIATFSGDESGFTAWIFRIARCRLVDSWRRAAARPRSDASDLATLPERAGGDVEDEALGRLGDGRVRVLLARLPESQREVLLLRVIADLTVEQVGKLVGRSPAAVKALQRRGLEQLRDIVAAERVQDALVVQPCEPFVRLNG